MAALTANVDLDKWSRLKQARNVWYQTLDIAVYLAVVLVNLAPATLTTLLGDFHGPPVSRAHIGYWPSTASTSVAKVRTVTGIMGADVSQRILVQ